MKKDVTNYLCPVHSLPGSAEEPCAACVANSEKLYLKNKEDSKMSMEKRGVVNTPKEKQAHDKTKKDQAKPKKPKKGGK